MNMSIKSITIATLLATTAPVAALAQADVSVGANTGASASVEGAGVDARASGNVSGNASGNAEGTEEGARDHASESAQASSEGSGSVDVDGDAETGVQGDGAGASTDLGITTFGRLISQLQAGEIADTEDFADFAIGTDGEVEIVTLSDLHETVTASDSQSNGAEARAAIDTAIEASAEADYSQLPESAFEGTDYDVEMVVAAVISAEGNLVVVVDDTD